MSENAIETRTNESLRTNYSGWFARLDRSKGFSLWIFGRQRRGKNDNGSHDKVGERGTIATVLNFDEERFRTLCGIYECADTARVYGFNLEDLFVELEKE